MQLTFLSPQQLTKSPLVFTALLFGMNNFNSADELPKAVLFQNVRIFDGKNSELSPPSNVLVQGDKIEDISIAKITVDANTSVIEGNGNTLMPGLIDAHTHYMIASIPHAIAATADIGYINLLAGQQAHKTLLQGFTTIRDAGGPVFGLKRAIDEGMIVGPRIYPSGAMISQSGGHGDFRFLYEVPKALGTPLSHAEQMGMSIIADGADTVLMRAREQLMLGASQIKIMAGGGVSSEYDPIDVTQYTEAELKAAVDAATNWGTYVMAHAYTPHAIQSAIAAGIKSIEHGQLMDETTAKMMAERGVWLCIQSFLDDEFANPKAGAARIKQLQVIAGTDNAYRLARQYHIKTAWGSDILFSPKLFSMHAAQVARLAKWYTPAEILKMVTADNAELLALSGPRNPYPGKLGVVEKGAIADLILVNGNPLADITLISHPQQNFVVIMKGGIIFKKVATAP